MSAWDDAVARERVERAQKLLVGYEVTGWDQLTKTQRTTLECLRWFAGETDTAPRDLKPDEEDEETSTLAAKEGT